MPIYIHDDRVTDAASFEQILDECRYVSCAERLRKQFEGVSRPEDMGTTGLVAWVVAGPGDSSRAYLRVRKAAKIVRARAGDLAGFRRAVRKAAYNRWLRERIDQHFDKIMEK